MIKTNWKYILIIVLAIALVTGTWTSVILLCSSSERTTTQMSRDDTSHVTVITVQNDDGSYVMDFDMSKWSYDATNDVYYQIGVVYCAAPETTDYESLGIYVPGVYLDGTKNADGTYTCVVNTTHTKSGYTASTAPIVIPVNTPGYSAQKAPTSYAYQGLSNYLDAGYIYVSAGCRGRYQGMSTSYNSGAPWGVTDLKAAIRYLRYNASLLPGNTEAIFTFGHSGGGAQSAIVGASGDSELYTDYLNSIGACMKDALGNTLSDAVMGSMCWCPITNLDVADAAYEWNMGQYMNTGTRAEGTFTKTLSNDLATAYAGYINALGLKDENGQKLTLSSSSTGIYTSGSYYTYLKNVIETSLNNFLQDTSWPYTPNASFSQDGHFPGGGKNTQTTNSTATTYASAKEYIASLNSDQTWITYDESTNTAQITSVADFVTHMKNATKDVAAFDDLNRNQAENSVFGTNSATALHFDKILTQLLKDNAQTYAAYSDYDASYLSAYSGDLSSTDTLNHTVAQRSNMYNPMYYLSDYYSGYNTSKVASYWRINTGIEQGDTATVTEMNLALALQANSQVTSVDFNTVWGQGHTMAERSGDSTTNMISWINDCLKS